MMILVAVAVAGWLPALLLSTKCSESPIVHKQVTSFELVMTPGSSLRSKELLLKGESESELESQESESPSQVKR